MSEFDPTNTGVITGRANKEYWVLFGICVANKSAEQTSKKMKQFFSFAHARDETPFETVSSIIAFGTLGIVLRRFKFGQYTRIERAWSEVVKLDVDKDLSVAKLESIHGIGPKTARMLMLYVEPDLEVAPLDTHVLKYLRLMGVPNVPKGTPPGGPAYKRLEDIFIAEAKAQGKTPRQLDSEVWNAYSSGDLTKLPTPIGVGRQRHD